MNVSANRDRAAPPTYISISDYFYWASAAARQEEDTDYHLTSLIFRLKLIWLLESAIFLVIRFYKHSLGMSLGA